MAGVFTADSITASRIELGASRCFMGPSPSPDLLLIFHPPRWGLNDELQCNLLGIFIGKTWPYPRSTRPRPLGDSHPLILLARVDDAPECRRRAGIKSPARLLMAQSRHPTSLSRCPLSGAKRT